MRKFFFFLSLLCVAFIAPQKAVAQNYDKAISINLGASLGVGYKQFFTKSSAMELGVDYNLRHRAVMFSAVYQYHIPLVSTLNVYMGGGINIGANHITSNVHNGSSFALGLDPNVGFEYTFINTPVSLALDYKPFLNLTTHSIANNVALRLRLAL